MNLLLLKIVGIAALVAGLMFGIHAIDQSRQNIGYQRAVAEYDKKLAEAKEAALDRERFLRTTVTEAQDARVKTETVIRRQLGAARVTAASLRGDIADYRKRLATASADAASAYADTGLRLLGECQDRYLEMAAAAKGHLADSVMYQTAWPKNGH